VDAPRGFLGSYPKSYYESAIEAGRILVSGKRVKCQYKIQGGDELSHTVHRHEPAVALSEFRETKYPSEQSPVDIVYEDESILVVDKPSTLPIHPCGAYHYNSLLEILSHWKPQSYGPGKLYTVYRLDRLTSGVVFLSKNASLARSLGNCLAERDGCEKIYLARVKGRFPLNISQRKSSQSTDNEGIKNESSDSWEFQCHTSRTNDVIPAPCVHGNFSESNTKHWKGGIRVSLNSPCIQSRNDNKISNDTQVDIESCAALGYWVTDQRGFVSTKEALFRQTFTMSESEILSLATKEAITPDKDASMNSNEKRSIYWLNFACPCRVLSHKNGVCEAGDFSHLAKESDRRGIKPAQTSFTLLSYDASLDTSTVLVKPVTGRTHQIRLHLQQLGHPIANDHCYGGELWYGDEDSKSACIKSREWLDKLDNANAIPLNRLRGMTNSAGEHVEQTQLTLVPAQATLSDAPATDAEISHIDANRPRKDGESILKFIEKTCVWCARSKGINMVDSNVEEKKEQTETAVFRRTLMEYFVRSQGIWLHALQYSLKKKDSNEEEEILSFQSKLPSWSSCHL
jgi:23S rRNA-/tRNA-specific pseudouridylate synthase